MANSYSMDIVQTAKAKLSAQKRSVIFPEGTDDRIIQAAIRLHADLPNVEPILVGDPVEIDARARSLNASPVDIKIIEPGNTTNKQDLIDAYLSVRPDTAHNVAERVIRKPLFLAGLMTRLGLVDAMVAGVTAPTARVIEAAMLTIGLEEGISTPSSFFIMQPPDSTRTLEFADCAVNVEPTIEELAAIGIASARSYKQLLGAIPRTAFLSFSTHGSAQHATVTRIRDAAALAKSLAPDLEFDGELQADAALIDTIAKVKIKRESAVAGHANVLIFPDLASANIAYKLVQHLGHATALGPFLQGFARPISDLSRGASVQDIVDTTIITLSRTVSA